MKAMGWEKVSNLLILILFMSNKYGIIWGKEKYKFKCDHLKTTVVQQKLTTL